MATVEKCPWCGAAKNIAGKYYECGSMPNGTWRSPHCDANALRARVELLEKTVIALLEARDEIRADGMVRAAMNADALKALGLQS